jgi:hypothetical protein
MLCGTAPLQNSLNLANDDDLYIIGEVERTFGISIGRKAESTYTVGEFYDLIQAECGTDKRTEACLSQIAFYRLRRALASLDNTAIKPDTPISIVYRLQKSSIGRKWKELGRRSGLSLPSLETPFRVQSLSAFSVGLLWTLALVGFVLGMYAWDRLLGLPKSAFVWTVAVGVPSLGIATNLGLYLAFRNIPRRLTAVGDLAREAAGCSFAELGQSRPAPSAADRWYALTAILRQISGHKLPISRDTTLFPR